MLLLNLFITSILNAQGVQTKLLSEKYISAMDSNAIVVTGRTYEGVLLLSNQSPLHRIGIPDLIESEPWELTFGDIQRLESDLFGKIKKHAPHFDRSKLMNGDMSEYLRQYLGVVDSQGERKILIGFLSKQMLDNSSLITPKQLFNEFLILDSTPSQYFMILYDIGEEHVKMLR